MSTLRDFISRIRSSHKLLSGDASISDRAIAAEIRAVNLLLLKRETDKRRLWNTDAAFHSLNCLRLEEVALNECCEAPSGITVARSTVRLPRIAEGNTGHLIQGVYNVTGSQRFDEVTLNRYINLMKLIPVKKKALYFFIYDGYLYVTNPDIKAVRIRAHFEDDIPEELLYPQNCDACQSSGPAPCTNPLDLEFRHAGYLADPIATMVRQRLLESYFRLNDDKSTDAKDDQVSKQ